MGNKGIYSMGEE